MDVNFNGFEKFLDAFANGATTDDLKEMFNVHQMVLNIKNEIQDTYDVHVKVDYVKCGDYYKIELAFNPRRVLSKEDAEALKDLIDVCDNVFNKAKSIKSTTSKK